MILKNGNYMQDTLCSMKEMFLTFPTILQVKWTYPGVPQGQKRKTNQMITQKQYLINKGDTLWNPLWTCTTGQKQFNDDWYVMHTHVHMCTCAHVHVNKSIYMCLSNI